MHLDETNKNQKENKEPHMLFSMIQKIVHTTQRKEYE
jgi:hypothetical protein